MLTPTFTTFTTRAMRDDSTPVGSDFIGGAEALPVKLAMPGLIVPGSDFGGGTVPLTAEVVRGEPEEERAA
jgi:hypothetical protein